MGLFLNLVAKTYGKVVVGDYEGSKIGVLYPDNNFFYIIPKSGKKVKVTGKDIECYKNLPDDNNVIYIVFNQNNMTIRSLISFTDEGLEVFNRTINTNPEIYILEESEDFEED